MDVRQSLNNAKRRAARTYVRGLESIDPQFARHVLGAQREFFLAAAAFFESEARHAEKAIGRMGRKDEG